MMVLLVRRERSCRSDYGGSHIRNGWSRRMWAEVLFELFVLSFSFVYVLINISFPYY